jgi:endonuclease III
MATKKSDRISKLLSSVELRTELPESLEDRTLLEHGMYAVLLRHMKPSQAQNALNGMSKAFPDWNELRVSQAQEIADAMATRSKAKSRIAAHLAPARAVKEYLAQVFQETHGLDLEFLRTDPAGGVKQLALIPVLGNEVAVYLSWVAEDHALPVSGGIVRVLDRLGAMTRTTSMKKARAALEEMVPAKDALRFGMLVGMVADRWCDSRKPSCWECPLASDCPMGKKVSKDWEAQQKRLAIARAKEEARAEAARVKEEARLAREAEKERKKAEREEEQRRKKMHREALAKAKKNAQKAEKAAAAKKKAAAAKRKTAKKKTTAKKTTAKKATAKKATKKATKKVAKKAVKKTTKKAAKKVTKKVAKKTTKKVAKKVAKKATKKKATTKKAAKKKTTKKARRR